MQMIKAALFVLLCSMVSKSSVNETDIIVSGESHGMVEGCECLREPGGGLARRAFVLKTFGERSNYLLLDAGGFAAGEMYDSYTEGRNSDSARTVAMMNGMGIIGYDAVAIGDDDLQYGGKWLIENAKKLSVPLISANCFTRDGSLLAKPFVYVKKGGVIYGITAVTSDERMISTDTNVEIRDPFVSLESIWKKLTKSSDVQIILSHLGNDWSEKLTEKFPDCDLIVNGHRKKSSDPLYIENKIPVMQFGFQGKSLSRARLSLTDNSIKIQKSGWIQIHQNLPEDSLLSKAILYTVLPRKDVFDLYIMSHCPYGMEALIEFLEFQKSFPDIQWEIRFIGTVENDGALNSLHGNPEVRDEMLWLAIKALYPEKWLDFLTLRSNMPVPSSGIPSTMDIDEKVINRWIAEHGKLALTGHYTRSTRLSINASPTLLKNNIPIEIQISKKRLAKDLCSSQNNVSLYCDSMPLCIDDPDCRKKGKIGRCIADTCEFRDAVRFPFTVLVNDSLDKHPEDVVIATTEELFPGAEILKVSMHGESGKKMLQKWNFPPLPFYLFGKDVSLAHNFTSIESGLNVVNGGFTFKNGIMGYNYLPSRKEMKGQIVLLIDPFLKDIQPVIDSLFSIVNNDKISIRPIVFTEQESALPGTLERFRQDEAVRWLIISNTFTDKLRNYMQSYAQQSGTSYWNIWARKAGIDIDSLTRRASEYGPDFLRENYQFISSLTLKEPLALLKDNRELVLPENGEDFGSFIRRGLSGK